MSTKSHNTTYKNCSLVDWLNTRDHPVIVFDGATGTSLQQQNLTANDFGGPEYEGCNEHLVITCPESVKKVHRQFLESGCDVIETNTFGATNIVLSEYGLEDKSYEINKLAAQIASELANEFSSEAKPRFVAGSIGPTTKLPTLGHINFDTLKESYKEQVRGLISGGIDLFIVETCQDVLQIKAALQAIKEVNKINIPTMVSVTMETTGTMLVGTDISAVVSILEPFDIDILGLNCASGPEQMKEHIKYLSQHSPFIVSCIPNAGLPENISGVAHYRLTPIELKMQLMHFIKDLGVQIIGGCCGTTPEHISELVKLSQDINKIPDKSTSLVKRKVRNSREPMAASIYSATPYEQDPSFLIVGERLNASGSKKVRDLLNVNNWDGLVSIARNQEKENAHIIDVNVDYVGRNGVSDMNKLVSKLATNIKLPLMLDSTEYEKMESGLKVYGGKCILNSTNYEDGDERFFKVLKLAKDYGCGIVVGTIDEEGMARSSDRKFLIAERAYRDIINYGILPQEIFYDPLALPISTGLEEDRKNAAETLKAIKSISNNLQGVHVILGISNISFGLNPSARITLNSVFLHQCCKFGMDAAIISPSKILPLSKIKEQHKKICIDLINDNRKFEDEICIYDPLTELTKIFEGVTSNDVRKSNEQLTNLNVEEQLKQHIIDGERIGLDKCLEKALKKYKPLDIINKYLLDGMKVVGELFGSGQMQLPFVLQSAETMKYAVSFLEPYMENESLDRQSKGTFLIATVKGDVHDIGKNLVDIILTNNGYDVINLGIKQDISSIIQAHKKYKPDCIAMSGLLVKSTAFMKDNLESFNDAGINIPVILGGAALTPKFVNTDCNSVYKGVVIYGKDAFTDLRFMDSYMLAKSNGQWSDQTGFINNKAYKQDVSIDIGLKTKNNNLTSVVSSKQVISYNRSSSIPAEIPVKVPFIGSNILENISLNDVIKYLDRNALFSSQWQMKRLKNQSKEDYINFIRNTAEPKLDELINKIIKDKLVRPSAVYGYFNCARKDNSVLVFNESKQNLIGKFVFPRQKSGNQYCISDYFQDLIKDSPSDFLPMQAVTMGHQASEFSQELFKKDQYSEYLYFHGLTVQLAEALAEYVHALIRKECGFMDNTPFNIRNILAQRYRGCRFSFGYPACPNVSDSKYQLKWLNSERIGLSIDSSDQLHPEQSTTAIIALHSNAKYFSA